MPYAITIAYLVVIFGTINIIRMALLMVGSDIYALKYAARKKKEDKMFQFPPFTIVIPAHNEEHTIVRSVESVYQSRYPKEKLHIVVVDDGSTDTTVRKIQHYRDTHRLSNLHIVSQKRAGKACALNNGIMNHAACELVMCLDADSYLASDALMNAARYFCDPRVVALSSNVKIRHTGKLLNLIQTFEYLVCYRMKRALTVFNMEYIIGGVGSTFRRSALQRVGYYDTDTVTEDIDLTMKLLRLGNKEHRVMYGSDVITYTESVLSIQGLMRQRFRWKYGRCQTFLKNIDIFFSRDSKYSKMLAWVYLPFTFFTDIAFFLEPLLVSYIAFVIVWYQDWVTFLSAFSVVAIYITLNLLAEDTLRWKEKIKLIVLAPSMFFFFYVLSFVEYVALIKSYLHVQRMYTEIGTYVRGWEHVLRNAIDKA